MARILISAVLLLMTFIPPLRADDFERFKTTTRLFVEASHFYWDEHYAGAKLLDESGMLYSVGASVDDICSAARSYRPELYRLTFGGKAQYFFGTVDYDGATWAGDPAQTDVDYTGVTLEAWLGALFKTRNPHWFVEPKLTLGYRNWSRDIISTAQAIGYKEKWQNCYTRLGVTAIAFLRKAYRLSLTGGTLIPLWAVNDANLFGSEISVSPDPFHPTLYAEAALAYQRVGLALYYEAFRFGASDVVDGGIFQPESYEERIGIRLMVAFY